MRVLVLDLSLDLEGRVLSPGLEGRGLGLAILSLTTSLIYRLSGERPGGPKKVIRRRIKDCLVKDYWTTKTAIE